MNVGEILLNLWNKSGFAQIITGFVSSNGWQNLVMLVIACVLLYLAIVKKFEPLLLLGIAFGCLLSNLPGAGLYNQQLWDAYVQGVPYVNAAGEVVEHITFTTIIHDGGLLDIFYIGVKSSLYPCLIFMGVGAMTDFGPLLSNPKSLLLGAAAQLGVFVAFFGAVLLGFTGKEAASIGIIGGADGPTAIFLTSRLAPHLLGAIAVAAYSYMALIPLIQPPIMNLMTTPEQRKIKMVQTRQVSKTEKIIFPIVVTIFVAMLLPDTAPLIGCLMLGNLFKECGVTDRLSDTVQNAMMNIVTILLSTAVGATMIGSRFLTVETLKIVLLGVIAFGISTAGGLLGGQVMCALTHGKVNPLIGSAGVSAVPMAARVANVQGQKANPSNFLLMHAMGPNVAGVIGSAIAAGFLLSVFG
ncbi:MAG: sodium ion-translocating decarboxylase subunit beta [Clostridiales bacterium]|nr:sodium ion-translocating decarboxylase subunit beta [Clostridiales bacterium]MCI6434854.1 sodium ion-translocating decarboxylase subunit beta [Clostridiales bacterium]